jgi:hypothetical protein
MSLADDEEYKAIKIEAHKQFILNIMKGHNATESYSLAFPNAGRKTAGVKGYKLKNQYANIIERNAPINPDKIEDVANQTLHNLTLMAFADLGKMVNAKGVPLPLHKVPKEIRMAITEIEVEGNKLKYKVGGKLKALEVLSKIARLNAPETEINISLINEEERDSKIREIVVRAMNRNEEEQEENKHFLPPSRPSRKNGSHPLPDDPLIKNIQVLSREDKSESED